MSEQRQSTPFPGKQRAIWKPTLAGMEQPLQSFDSFVRTAPPHPSPPTHKPLPPIPSPNNKPARIASPPHLNRLPNRNFSFTDWKAPADWDEPSSPRQDLRISSPPVAPRSWEPLLPEPSPGSFDSPEQSPWPLTPTSLRYSHLGPIDEHGSHIPSPSPYHMSSFSPMHRPIPESDCGFSMSSSILNTSAASPMTIGTCPIASYNTNMEILAPSPISDIILHTSNISANHKALASLGIESTGNRQKEPLHWAGPITSPHDNNNCHAALQPRGKGLQSSVREPQLDDISEDEDMSERLQQLGVSQDYHNVLADQYQEAHDPRSRTMNVGNNGRNHDPAKAPKETSKDGELMPRPLSWKKSLYGSSPRSSNSDTHAVATFPPDSRKRHRKITSWVPFHQPAHAQKRRNINIDQSQSVNDTIVASRRELFGTELDRLMHKEIHLSHFIPHMRGSKSDISDDNTRHNDTPPKPASPHPRSRMRPSDQSVPLLRLPGGLALVRSTPTPTPIVRDDNILNISSPIISTQSSPPSDYPAFDIHPVERRRSSLYSQQSQSPVAPAILVHRKLRSSHNSSYSHRFRPSTSSPPTSPLAHEIEFPRTPPPIPRGPNSPPARLRGQEELIDHDRADSANEDEPHRGRLHIGISDKARDARDTWKKHQRDAKHEKLKQSIRILGPTDLGVAAAYVKRQGRTSGDEGSRMPGFMGDGFI
jgi:hypothetical protein